MKIRQGFVSNSSSSSFVINDKNNMKSAIQILEEIEEDYYILDDTLYTSFIGDGCEEYSDLFALCDDSIDGGHCCPYNEEDFVEVEGIMGVSSVYIPMSATDKQKIIDEVGKQLYSYLLSVQRNFDVHDSEQAFNNELLNEESIYIVEKCLDLIKFGKIKGD